MLQLEVTSKPQSAEFFVASGQGAAEIIAGDREHYYIEL
jgi:hypothetical protein